VPVIVVAPKDALFEKTVSNMQEVAARGGRILLLTTAGVEHDIVQGGAVVELPAAHDFINPILYAVPVQLLAYFTAVAMGTDVDQPRNLAKSVTVE
jgi:glucosamine--fructose-6-phosphate aminotransferase (isomerizing)